METSNIFKTGKRLKYFQKKMKHLQSITNRMISSLKLGIKEFEEFNDDLNKE